LTGIYTQTSGSVYLNGDDITGLKPYEIAQRRISRTFQTPRVFEELTVLENVMVPLFNTKQNKEVIEKKARKNISLVDLSHTMEEKSKNLSGGQKKLLEFARCLMRNPQIILMDEPFAGVHADIKQVMTDRIKTLQKDGTDFIIVSHEVDSLYALANRIHVFESGSLLVSGVPEEIQENNKVIKAYL